MGAQFNVSHTVIGRLWTRYQQINSVQQRPKSGRPKSMIAHQDRQTALLPDVMPTGVYVIFDLYFSDESRFCLDYHDGQRRVWRQKNERFKNCCVAEHDRFGGGSIMVWGGISYDGSTDLYVIRNGSLTCIRYRDEILAPIIKTLRWCNW